MKDEIKINNIDVTNYRNSWNFNETWGGSIPSLTLRLSKSVATLLTISNGLNITVKRGRTIPTDEFIFDGQITQFKPRADFFECECKGKLIEAIKAGRTKSWDKNIDTEAGVGSEIFKTLCDNSNLNYNASSIISTGTLDKDKIVKLIQNDEDDFVIMNRLAERYNYTIRYIPSDGYVYFKPKGYITYSKTLNVGIEIPKSIKWKENMEELINKVKVLGATVLDKDVYTNAGPASVFTLPKTPEDTEVRINHAGADTLQVRGQKDLGTVGTDYNYYVEEDQKTITFANNVSDLWVKYGTQVPMPVVVKNQTSIDTYGGANKTPHFKRFTFPDLKDIKDAEDKGRDILEKYSTPFVTAPAIPITDTTIETYGDIEPGNIVRIIDSQTNKDVIVFVEAIEKSFPHVYDKITVGDKIWRTTDWQVDQMEKINKLLSELNKNQDLVINMFDIEHTLDYKRRYLELQKKDRSGEGVNTFILGHPTFGILGTQELGDGGSSYATMQIVQENNIYEEYFYDSTFSGTGTATWNTVNKELSFTSGQSRITSLLTLGASYKYYTLTLGSSSGTITIEISGDGGSTYETVSLGVRTIFGSSDATGVKLKLTEAGASTAKIENIYTTEGAYDSPGIKIQLEE